MPEKIKIKEWEEKQLLRHFIQVFPEFPKGKIKKSESPDFIVKISRHRIIGIELTKLFLLKDRDSVHFVPHFEEKRTLLIEEVRRRFNEAFDYHCTIHFSFDNSFNEPGEDIGQLSKELFDLIFKKIRDWDPNAYSYCKIQKRDLPEYMNSISLIHHPNDKISHWVSCEESVPPENYLESIQRAIDHKLDKLPLYQSNRFDEYWLLIVADCLKCATHFNIYNLLERWQFDSKFHQVFLFELFEQKVHRLKWK